MRVSTEDFQIFNDELVTVTIMNNILEVQYLQRQNTKATIKTLPDGRFVVLSTGEVRERERKSKTRAESLEGLRRTFKRLRYLINANFTGAQNELFITLTFAPNAEGWRPGVEDTEYIANSWKKFQRKLVRKFGKYEWIRVLEPHADGKAHLHALLKFNHLKKIFISNDDLATAWGLGFVRVNSLKDVDNVGAYVSAYLTDIEVTPENIFKIAELDKRKDKSVAEKNSKKYLKGGRLIFYPSGTQIYGKSKGLKEPVRVTMTYQEAKKRVAGKEPDYSKTFVIENEDFQNKGKFESYNLNRK